MEPWLRESLLLADATQDPSNSRASYAHNAEVACYQPINEEDLSLLLLGFGLINTLCYVCWYFECFYGELRVRVQNVVIEIFWAQAANPPKLS